jgi:glycosyltransferase involved in cell wall biosynthesis
MIRVNKPSAIVYGWRETGTFTLKSDIYFQENLYDDVVIHSIEYTGDVLLDYSKYKTDLIISTIPVDIKHPALKKIYYSYSQYPADNVLANDVVCQSVFKGCERLVPFFSVFTPAYKTGERIRRTYESLINQKFLDWEWVIVDDSPDEETWNIIKEISQKDFRVKPHRILPVTGGNVGLAKNRASMLCWGEWLVELDHDDYLLPDCLLECFNASKKFPDAGFIYTNATEMYEDGSFRYYSADTSGNWEKDPSLGFAFGYAGHSIVNIEGKEYVHHQYPSINPLTIRFNISMPNHARMWKREIYHNVLGHNRDLPVADDLELIIRTFLVTRMIHVKKLLYIQYNNRNSTVDNNVIDINRRARLIKDFYDLKIHKRIQDLGKIDWNWYEKENHSSKSLSWYLIPRYGEEEQVMNYVYE